MRAWLALAAGAAAYAVAVLWSAARLPPDGVLLNFGAAGLANRFGSRAEPLTLHVGLGALTVGLGVASVGLARWGPLTLVNVPHKVYWTAPRRRARFRRMVALDVGAMLGITVAALGLIPVASVLALRAEPVGLPPAADVVGHRRRRAGDARVVRMAGALPVPAASDLTRPTPCDRWRFRLGAARLGR